MKYNELKNIIRHIKRHIPCQGCAHSFKEKEIKIVGMINDTVVLNLICESCKSSTIVQVSLLGENREVSFNKVDSREPISKDDILDMHNFLKNFKGDINEFFKK